MELGLRARLLFKRLDPDVWKNTQHNPVKLLHTIAPDRLVAAARDPDFLREYDVTMKGFDRAMRVSEKWFPREFPDLAKQSIAYFSAEFGIHTSLPIYSGGLGILQVITAKNPATWGSRSLASGLFIRRDTSISEFRSTAGRRIFTNCSIDAKPRSSGQRRSRGRYLVELKVGSLNVFVAVWRVNVGSVPVYLMDTDVEENVQADRELTARLYGGDKEHRIRQEIVLGVGGVRVLRALGIQPAVYHANEGHTSFMLLERTRELVQQGQTFEEAAEQIRSTSLFTTHTPVPAGHDAFPLHMMEKYFAGYWDDLGISKQAFMELGRFGDSFNMTVLALRMTGWRNAVSHLHGRVTRRMWQVVWPDSPEDKIPDYVGHKRRSCSDMDRAGIESSV